MTTTKGIRIVSNGDVYRGTQVYDADTGEIIQFVKAVSVNLDANSPSARADVRMVVGIPVEYEGPAEISGELFEWMADRSGDPIEAMAIAIWNRRVSRDMAEYGPRFVKETEWGRLEARVREDVRHEARVALQALEAFIRGQTP